MVFHSKLTANISENEQFSTTPGAEVPVRTQGTGRKRQKRRPQKTSNRGAGEELTKTTSASSEKSRIVRSHHVFSVFTIQPWLRTAFEKNESSLAFLCGASCSGKTTVAETVQKEYPDSVLIVNTDEELQVALERTKEETFAVLVDRNNCRFPDYGNAVNLAMEVGVSFNNLAWFVLDQQLPEDKEAELLMVRQQERNYYEKTESIPAEKVLEQVRQIRLTYFNHEKELVRWSTDLIRLVISKSALPSPKAAKSKRNRNKEKKKNATNRKEEISSQGEESVGYLSVGCQSIHATARRCSSIRTVSSSEGSSLREVPFYDVQSNFDGLNSQHQDSVMLGGLPTMSTSPPHETTSSGAAKGLLDDLESQQITPVVPDLNTDEVQSLLRLLYKQPSRRKTTQSSKRRGKKASKKDLPKPIESPTSAEGKPALMSADISVPRMEMSWVPLGNSASTTPMYPSSLAMDDAISGRTSPQGSMDSPPRTMSQVSQTMSQGLMGSQNLGSANMLNVTSLEHLNLLLVHYGLEDGMPGCTTSQVSMERSGQTASQGPMGNRDLEAGSMLNLPSLEHLNLLLEHYGLCAYDPNQNAQDAMPDPNPNPMPNTMPNTMPDTMPNSMLDNMLGAAPLPKLLLQLLCDVVVSSADMQPLKAPQTIASQTIAQTMPDLQQSTPSNYVSNYVPDLMPEIQQSLRSLLH